jgi:hypothetical protein
MLRKIVGCNDDLSWLELRPSECRRLAVRTCRITNVCIIKNSVTNALYIC